MIKKYNEFVNEKSQYNSFQEFINEHVGKEFSIKIGSGTQSQRNATKIFIEEQIKDFIWHYFFNWDFYFNWITEEQKKEYKDKFKIEVENKLNNFSDFYNKYIEISSEGRMYPTLYKLKLDTFFLDRDFFLKYKKSISKELINDYIDYRKKYAGENISI